MKELTLIFSFYFLVLVCSECVFVFKFNVARATFAMIRI